MLQPVTPFEKEIAEALKQRNPDHVIHKGKVFTPAEEKELAGMTLEEVGFPYDFRSIYQGFWVCLFIFVC